jgi:hypothetical protein
MAYPVQGKNGIMEIYRSDIASYVPFMCAKGIEIVENTPEIETTTQDSGSNRTYISSALNDYTMTLTGIVFIRDLSAAKYFVFDTLLDAIRHTRVLYRLIFTDDEGEVKTLSGETLITQTLINSTAGQLANFSNTFRGSGALSIDPITSPTTGANMRFFYKAVGGETFVQDASLVARTIQHVDWDLDGALEVITVGTPSSRQVKYTSATGRFDFDPLNPMIADQQIVILYN